MRAVQTETRNEDPREVQRGEKDEANEATCVPSCKVVLEAKVDPERGDQRGNDEETLLHPEPVE